MVFIRGKEKEKEGEKESNAQRKIDHDAFQSNAIPNALLYTDLEKAVLLRPSSIILAVQIKTLGSHLALLLLGEAEEEERNSSSFESRCITHHFPPAPHLSQTGDAYLAISTPPVAPKQVSIHTPSQSRTIDLPIAFLMSP